MKVGISLPGRLIAAGVLVFSLAGGAMAKDYDPEQALAYSQGAIGNRVADYAFRDSRGREVKLSDFRGKPLAVSFIYTACEHTCPTITATLADAAGVARDALGRDSFTLLTIGFDSRNDSPQRMRYYARLNDVHGEPNWKFLSGDKATIDNLAKDLGFIYFASPKGFDHLAQTTIIDGQGTVYRQVYGEAFATPHFVEPLKELVFGTTSPFTSIGDLIKKVRLFCTIYDAAGDRYRFDYSIFFQLFAGATMIVAMAVFVVRGVLGIRRRRRRPGPGNSTA